MCPSFAKTTKIKAVKESPEKEVNFAGGKAKKFHASGQQGNSMRKAIEDRKPPYISASSPDLEIAKETSPITSLIFRPAERQRL